MTSIERAVEERASYAAPDPLTFTSSRVIVAGLLASCAPLILLAFNRDWIFTPEIYLDPWHYVGFFREYLNPDYSPGAYKLARLPWILAGFATHRVLPPVAAAYVLHGAFLCATSAALFVGLYALVRRVALAAVVAIALGFYTHAHGSGGWDYHNTAAGAFYLVAFMLFALPSTIRGWRVPLMFAGAAAALAVHSNITFVNFLPATAFVYVQAARTRDPSPPTASEFVARALWASTGGVLVTVLLCVTNWMAGREFLFFAPLVDITARYVADPQTVARWYHGWSEGWELKAIHLAVPAALLAVGSAFLVLRRRSATQGSDRLVQSLVLQFVVMAIVWIGWQTAGQLALDWNYFAYPLIPSCFIALGGLLSFGWPDALERHWLATSLAVIVACASCLVGALDPSIQAISALIEPAVAGVGCAFIAAGLVAYLVRPGVAAAVVALAVFAVGNRLVAANPINYLAADPCQMQSGVHAAVVEGASFLGAIDPAYSRVRVWFDQSEQSEDGACPLRIGYLASAVMTTASISYVSNPWPVADPDKVPDVAVQAIANDGGILAIISNRSDRLEAWRARLNRMGLTYREVGRRRVPLLASGFTIDAWEIGQKAPTGTTFGKPVFVATAQTTPQVNIYGGRRGHVRANGDASVFVPADERDHISYPFTELSPTADGVWAQLTVEFPPSMTNPASCRLSVQDRAFTSLATIPCASRTRFMRLPPNVSALRVYLTDPRSRPFAIPRKIEIALADPTP